MLNKALFQSSQPPRHIAIEGPIGVGKSTLMRRLAESLNYATLAEKAEENPFLERFYSNRQHGALSTQLFFLFQRAQQMSDLQQDDLFAQGYVADFLFQKDPLFARLTLDANELDLYHKVYQQLSIDLPQADLVIYLQAPSKVLKERIAQRGIRFERNIDSHYLEQVNEAYSEYFLHYSDSPLLIVNAEDIDFAHSDRDYQQLLDYLLEIPSGRHYFNPTFF